MSWDKTHDISSIDSPKLDLEALRQLLTSAASAAFPTRRESRYQEVYVLLLNWEEDELGVNGELSKLQSVLRNLYNFYTEEWKIPSHRSHDSLAKKVTTFVEDYEGKDNLLIVYYGGHGAMSDQQCWWSR